MKQEKNHKSVLRPMHTMLIRGGLLLLAANLLLFLLAMSGPPTAQAVGGGCEDATLPEAPGFGDNGGSYTAPAGEVITGVCIKAGTNMFGGGHSGVLGNGTYENGCYQVSGVGTGTVTVTRIGEPSSTCQEISHVDVYYDPGTSPSIDQPSDPPAAEDNATSSAPVEENTPSDPSNSPSPSDPATPSTESAPGQSDPAPSSEVLGIEVLPTTGFGPPPVDAGSLGLGLRLVASAFMTLSGLALRRLTR